MAVRLFRSIFIHVPKTGGTWVRGALRAAGLHQGDVGRDHATPAEIEQDPAYQASPMVFCFVRHPLAWYQSYWCYRMKHGWHKPSPGEVEAPIRTVTLDAHCRDDRFDRFVENCLERYPQGWVSHLYAHYTSGCTFVGRQERLVEDLLLALLIAGEPVDAARIRNHPPQNVAAQQTVWRQQCQYPKELALRVLEAESQALQRWGYVSSPCSACRGTV